MKEGGMLIGERTILRPLERSDMPLVAAWRNDPSVRAQFFNPYLIALSGQDKWYDNYLIRNDSLLYIIYELDNNERIGLVGLDHIDHRNQSAEYGRMLIADTEKRGHGYAHDATLTLINYAFMDLNMNRLYLRLYADNARALKLYERCGFVREGVEREAIFMDGRFRDLILMSILRNDRTTQDITK
jgi:diamine N-acetyltransferase